jgi:hypothetical protein
MIRTPIEVMKQVTKWLALLANPKLCMPIRITLNASRMPEPEGRITAKVGPCFRGRNSLTFPAGAVDAR